MNHHFCHPGPIVFTLLILFSAFLILLGFFCHWALLSKWASTLITTSMLKTIESLITTKGSQVCQEYYNTDYSCISMKTLVILIFFLHYYNYQVIQRKVGKSYSQVLQYVYHFLRRRIKEGTVTFSQKKKKEGIITLNKNKGKVDQFLKGIGLGYIFTKKIYGKRKNQLVFFYDFLYLS